MHRMFAAALLAASMAGGAALVPSGALAATIPGPAAIPSLAVVRNVDPEISGVEKIGRRQSSDDSHRAWVRNEMHQVRTGDYTYRVDMNEGNRLIPRFDPYANYLRRTRNPRDLMFPDPRPRAYKLNRR
jgi:hypothetical protein